MSKKKTQLTTIIAGCRHSFCDAVRMPDSGQTAAYFCGILPRQLCRLYRDSNLHCFDKYKGVEAIAS